MTPEGKAYKEKQMAKDGEETELAKEEMEKAIPLDVPIVVQGNFGENWEEAH